MNPYDIEEELKKTKAQLSRARGALADDDRRILKGIVYLVFGVFTCIAGLRAVWLWSSHQWPDTCEPVKTQTTDPKVLEQK